MMQVKVPAGIRPGMGFMVASPEGTQFQVQCPPVTVRSRIASEGMLISVALQDASIRERRGLICATRSCLCSPSCLCSHRVKSTCSRSSCPTIRTLR